MSDHHAKILRLKNLDKEVIKQTVSTFAIEAVEYLEFSNFTISDSRLLINKAFVRPAVGQKQLLVVMFGQITVEAQQSLLKILEEPPETTVFLFCVPDTLKLLPTLNSRFHLITAKENRSIKSLTQSFVKFLAMNYADRLDIIAKKTKTKDLEWVSEMKLGLMSWLDTQDLAKLDQNFSQTMLEVGELLGSRGASNKYLLEEIALSLLIYPEQMSH